MTDEIVRCRDCEHWTHSNYNRHQTEITEWCTGICTGIHPEIEIEVNAGWDGGVVGDIETGQNFFCAAGEKRKEGEENG